MPPADLVIDLGHASLPVAVGWGAVRDEVVRLFPGQTAPPADAAPALLDVHQPGGDELVVTTGAGSVETVSLRRLGGTLLPHVTRAVLDAEAAWPHLHASAAVVGGRAVVLSGRSGSGKTVLAAQLAKDGGIVTDEMLAVDRAAGVVRSVGRPLSIVDPRGGPLEPLIRELDQVPHERDWWAPPAALGLEAVEAALPGVVLVIDRRPGPPVLAPLDRATTLASLLENSFDAPRRPQRLLLDLAWLVTSTSTLRASYEEAIDLVPLVESAVADIERSGEVEPVPPATGRGRRRHHQVASVVVDGRAVLYDRRDRRIVRLDPAATNLWTALDGHRSPPGDAEGFIEDLIGARLVEEGQEHA